MQAPCYDRSMHNFTKYSGMPKSELFRVWLSGIQNRSKSKQNRLVFGLFTSLDCFRYNFYIKHSRLVLGFNIVQISDTIFCPKTKKFCSDFGQMPKTEPFDNLTIFFCPKSELFRFWRSTVVNLQLRVHVVLCLQIYHQHDVLLWKDRCHKA